MTETTVSDNLLIDQLEDIVGSRFVMRRESDLLVYNSDGLPGYRRMPRIKSSPSFARSQPTAFRSFRAEQAPGYLEARSLMVSCCSDCTG